MSKNDYPFSVPSLFELLQSFNSCQIVTVFINIHFKKVLKEFMKKLENERFFSNIEMKIFL